MSGFPGRLCSYTSGTDWIARAIVVPCPSCGRRLHVPDVATDLGAVAALHELPACPRFEAITKIGELARYLREVAEAEPDDRPS